MNYSAIIMSLLNPSEIEELNNCQEPLCVWLHQKTQKENTTIRSWFIARKIKDYVALRITKIITAELIRNKIMKPG